MDMQGTPIGSTNQGMKNTSDPERYQNPTKEGAGAVASDSLAAESTRSGGGFSSNRDSEPQSVSGSKSTFANTDTSGAQTLPPASSASERGSKDSQGDGPGGQKYPEAAGKAEFPGSHSEQGYAGGPTSAKQAMSSGNSSSTNQPSGGGSTGGSSSAGGSSSTGNTSSTDNNNSSTTGNSSADSSGIVDSAPGYVASVVSNPGKSGKPHGKNITEGGFDSDDSKNASFNSEIGSKDDPGRKAENDFETKTQSASGDTGPRQYDQKGNSTYGVLDTDQSL